jgi:hypothetical protein
MFWRAILDAAPSSFDKRNSKDKRGSRELHGIGGFSEGADGGIRRQRLQPYQIQELLADTAYMRDHIKNSMLAKSGIIATHKMPFFVPQSFDKKPYMTLSDGKKVTIYREKQGLFAVEDSSHSHLLFQDGGRKMKSLAASTIDQPTMSRGVGDGNKLVSKRSALETNATTAVAKHATSASASVSASAPTTDVRRPVHIFNVVFWPLTTAIEAENDSSTLLYDSHMNGLEIAESKRNSYTLTCEQCDRRLRMVHCSTCQKGYCFFCAFR